MTPDDFYRRHLEALRTNNETVLDADINMLMNLDFDDDGSEAIADAIEKALDDYIAERFPRLRAEIGDLAAAGHVDLAVLMDRIFLGDAENDD